MFQHFDFSISLDHIIVLVNNNSLFILELCTLLYLVVCPVFLNILLFVSRLVHGRRKQVALRECVRASKLVCFYNIEQRYFTFLRWMYFASTMIPEFFCALDACQFLCYFRNKIPLSFLKSQYHMLVIFKIEKKNVIQKHIHMLTPTSKQLPIVHNVKAINYNFSISFRVWKRKKKWKATLSMMSNVWIL